MRRSSNGGPIGRRSDDGASGERVRSDGAKSDAAKSDSNSTGDSKTSWESRLNFSDVPKHGEPDAACATSKVIQAVATQPGGSAKHFDAALAEQAVGKSKVRLAAAEEDQAPALIDPFGDKPTKSVLKHRTAVAMDDAENSTPAQVERESPPEMRLSMGPTKQTPEELQPVDPLSTSGSLPGRSVKVFPAMQPMPGPETLQPNGPDTLPELSTRRALQNPAEDCRDAYNMLRGNTLNKVSIDIKVPSKSGDIPYECSMGESQFTPRCWQLTTYTWKASSLCHKPLYFEEEALERYGHSHGWVAEDLVSCAHFFGNVALLPYHVGVETPCECIYDLGVYRAGDCAPYTLDPFPISLRGAVTGAVGYGAVIALFP